MFQFLNTRIVLKPSQVLVLELSLLELGEGVFDGLYNVYN